MAMTSFKFPKPKEHGAWGMLYVPFFVAVGVSGTFNVQVFLLLLAVTLIFLSQRPFTQVLSSRQQPVSAQLRADIYWLGACWAASALLFLILFSYFRLFDLIWFGLIGLPIIAAFIYFIRRNAVRSLPGEFVGVLGLTLSAPLAHYVAAGRLQPTGFLLWSINILYFGSSIFYVKAKVHQFMKHKSKTSRENGSNPQLCRIYHWTLLSLLLGLILWERLPALAVVAFLPIILRGVWGIGKPVARLNFKQIGLLEVAYSVFFGLVIIWAL